MKYALIARDADMVICEYKTAEATEQLIKKVRQRVRKTKVPLERRKTKAGDMICVKNDILIFACAASSAIREEKAATFLDELKDSFELFYKVGLDKIHQQSNLRANILDVPFKRNFEKLFNKYNTGINMSVLQVAKSEAGKLKTELQKSLQKQVTSTKDTEKFLDTAFLINDQAKMFEKETAKLEEVTRKRNWWCCSCSCISTFVIAGGGVVGLILLLMLLI